MTVHKLLYTLVINLLYCIPFQSVVKDPFSPEFELLIQLFPNQDDETTGRPASLGVRARAQAVLS